MKCENCGAEFEENLPKCPYCGALYYEGAQQEYMNKLHTMRKDMDELHEAVPKVYQTELKNQSRLIKKVILICLVVVGVLALLAAAWNFWEDTIYVRDEKEALLAAREVFPILDKYYEAEDYDGLMEYYFGSLQEYENLDVYNWEHYPILMCLANMEYFREAEEAMGTKEFSEYHMQELFFCYIDNRDYQKNYSLKEKDAEIAAALEEEMKAVIGRLELTAEEQKEFEEFLNSSKFVSWDEITQFAGRVYRRLYK